MATRVISNKVYEQIQPFNVQPETTGTILYANKFSGTDPVAMPKWLKHLFDSDMGLNGTNLLIQLQNKVRFLPNGPWYVDSRDGVIYIHNRKFQEEPVRTYTYQNENGEVLKVQFTTQWVTKSTKVVLHETIRPDNKVVEATRVEYEEKKNDNEIINQIDNTQVVNPWNTTRFHEDYRTHPSDVGVEDEMDLVYSLTQQKKLREEADLKLREKMSEDPMAGIKKVQNDYLSTLTTSETLAMINQAKNDNDLTESVKKRIDLLSSQMNYITDPKEYEAKMKELLDILKFTVELEHYEWKEVDPISFSEDPTYKDRLDDTQGTWRGIFNDSHSAQSQLNQLRLNGYDKLKQDPNVLKVEVVESYTGYVPGQYYEQQGLPKKVRYMVKTKSGVKIPLYQAWYNMIGRYGGTDRVMWAAKANANGGLKRKEKELQVLMTVVGRPQLTSSMVINIQNIGRRWSGPWYIKKCTHRMDAGSGYLCDLELVKNSSVGGSNTSAVGLSTQEVLHVWTDSNGKTQYGKKDPYESEATKFYSTFDREERAYYSQLYKGDRGDFLDAVAVKQAYNEKYADDPWELAKGTVETNEIIIGSEGVETMGTIHQRTLEDMGLTPEEVAVKRSKLPDVKKYAEIKREKFLNKIRNSAKVVVEGSNEVSSTGDDILERLKEQVGL